MVKHTSTDKSDKGIIVFIKSQQNFVKATRKPLLKFKTNHFRSPKLNPNHTWISEFKIPCVC